MKYLFLTLCLLLISVAAFEQNKAPRLEAYGGTGLFFEQLNNDTLVPEKRRNTSRLGDVSSYGLQVTMQAGKSRWLIKGGLGYSERHYSMNKYTLGDFFTDLFLFDSPPPHDTSSISYVRLTNQYLQVPVTIAYSIIRRKRGIGGAFTAGLNMRSDILLNSSAQVEFDATYIQPTAATVNQFKKLYTQNATAYVLTIEPYLEGSFFVYKGIGMYIQVRPFSFYSSPFDKRFTSGTFELVGSSFGLMYDFNR